MRLLARIFHIDPAAACESLMQTALGSGLRLGSMSNTALRSNPRPPCLHHTALRLATNRYEISGLAIILITLFSIVSLHASPDGSGTGDQFNFSSLVSRSSERILTSLGDLPDGIIPVAVKDQGNQNDPDTGFGMVIQEYSIAQTEVTARQYCNYLNVVATGDNYLLFYNEKMGSDPNVASIKREVIDDKNQYSVIVDEQGDRGNFPIVHVNLYQAARFCNWLQNQNTPGLKDDALTERGAYTLNGKSSGPIARNPGAVWFIPTENEWYKSAYYKGGGLKEGYWNFANRSDWAPSHSLNGGENSANYCSSSYTKKGPPYLTPVDYFKQSVGTYNTYDMSGNVAEWVATEENQGGSPLKYVARGGSWKSLYYGAAFRSKFDVANWGLELSKSSRPAYDPAQGYDNIGFRVATSLIVNSAPPDKAAPGAAELSPTETIEAPFFLLVGAAAFFSGKNINNYRRNVKVVNAAEAEQGDTKRQFTEDETRGNQVETERNPSGIARIGEKKQAGATTPPPSPEKITITPSEKEEIETSIAAIDPLFDHAEAEYQAYKQFLQKEGGSHSGGLQQLQKMCDAYDDYATAVATAAVNIKEQFPEEQELWIPWYTAAMNVESEAMLLRHAAIKPYYRMGIFPLQVEAPLKQEVARLRNDSNQKALQYIATIKNYQEFLNAVIQEQGNPSQQSVAATILQKIDVETASLEAIESTIKEHESEIQTSVSIGATAINGAYSDYEKVKEQENDNLFALFFLHHDKTQRSITNLVSSAPLREQFQQFLSQLPVDQGVSPGGISPAKIMDLTFFYGDEKTDGSIGEMNNPQWRAREDDNEVRQGIQGKIVPFNLWEFLKEKFKDADREGYEIIPRKGEPGYNNNK
ncbi:MAG: formylglycine-generating enzyme family protein [Chthoniobacterales bacterium]|nr:formylglycine-generating enzyme family protein [Chthoniobacterales bacterium]